MKTEIARLVLGCAESVIANAAAGRIYDPLVVDWAKFILAGNEAQTQTTARSRSAAAGRPLIPTILARACEAAACSGAEVGDVDNTPAARESAALLAYLFRTSTLQRLALIGGLAIAPCPTEAV